MTKVLPNTHKNWKYVKTLPCKHCGAEAIIGGEPWFEWWQHYICCSNYNCPHRHSDKIESGTNSIRSIIEKWNNQNKVEKMNEQFLFKAYIKAFYTKDNEDDGEVLLMFYDFSIENGGQQIGFSDSELLRAIDDTKLSEKEKESVQQWFEANYSTENDEWYWGDVDSLVQCTAIKDKKGQFIYVGDIVEYKIGSLKVRGIVKYSLESGGYFKGGTPLGTYQKSMVIIGNIHENPELIGGAE